MKDYTEIVRLVKYSIKKLGLKTDLYGDYEDLLQTMLLEVYIKLPKYEPEKSRLSTFVYVIVKNKYLYDIRKSNTSKQKSNFECISLDEEIKSLDNRATTLKDIIPDSRDYIQNLEDKLIIKDCLHLLNKEAKLYLIDELNQKEIAEKVNSSQVNVSRRIKKSLNEIRKFIEGEPIIIKRNKRFKLNALQYSREHNCSIRTVYRHLGKDKESVNG